MTRNNRKTSWIGLLLLAACNSAPPAPESWLGATEADVLARFGKPSAELINDDDNRVIVFTAASTLMFGGGEPCDGFSEDACRLKGNLVLNQEDTGVRAIVARCSVFFEVNAGVVSKWTWAGGSVTGFLIPPSADAPRIQLHPRRADPPNLTIRFRRAVPPRGVAPWIVQCLRTGFSSFDFP